MSSLSEITVYLRRDLVAELVGALNEAGVRRLWVGHVHALGAGVDPEDFRVSFEDGCSYSEKARIVCLAERDDVEELMALIRDRAGTGHRGDGLVLVREAGEVVNVRTGERDRLALI